MNANVVTKRPTEGRAREIQDQLDLAHHDIEKLIDSDERFRARLLGLLDARRIAQAKALCRWGLR